MKMNMKLGVILFMSATCLSAVAAAPADSAKPAQAGPSKAKPSAPVVIFNRKLSSTSISLGTDVVDLSSGRQAIDSPLNFTCPSGGCTITAEIHVQVGFNTTAGNPLSLCAELDGAFMPPGGCPNVLTLPTDDSFVAESFTFAQSGVTAGHHTVQGFLSTTDGITLANYTITYRLYTP